MDEICLLSNVLARLQSIDPNAFMTKEFEGYVKTRGELPNDVNPYAHILKRCTEILEQRGKEYNNGQVTIESYFPFGHVSYIQMIHLKSQRLLSQIEKKSVNTDVVLDTVFDLINYILFYAKWLEDRNVQC